MSDGRRMLRSALAVFIGGVIGTSTRLGVDALIPHGDAAFPVSTLVINVVGSFALAVLVGRVWPTAPGWARAGLRPGLLGSFTTFSAVAVSLVSLAEADAFPIAALYLALTLLLGFAAAAVGLALGRKPAPGRGSCGPVPVGRDE